MNIESGRKFYKYASADDARQRVTADAKERELVLAELKTCLNKQPPEQQILGWDYQFELQKHSSLYDIHAPGQKLLIELISRVSVRSLLTRETLSDRPPVCVTRTGKMEVLAETSWLDFVALGYLDDLKIEKSLIPMLTDIATAAGGYIWSDNEIMVNQWLEFHGFDVPENIAQLENLIDYFEFEFPEVDGLGNYWGQLITDDHALIVLSAEQCTAIKNVTAQHVPGNTRLLDNLLRGTRVGVAVHDNAAQLLKQVIGHPLAQSLANSCLQRLGWFGAQTGQVMSAPQLEQLLVTAMLLDINPLLGKHQGRKSVGTYEMYSPRYLGRPAAVVIEGLRAHMVANAWVNQDAAPLAIHLCLAQNAPEFLVRQVPTSLIVGSLEWVAFCRAVALVEAVARGAARVMTYSQVMAYAELEPVSQAMADVQMLALIDPIVDWALINSVVTETELRQAEQATTQRAITAYQHYVANFSQVGHAYATPLPDRKSIARAALTRAAPACDFLETPVLNQRPGLYASPTRMSLVDLHMSGDLKKQEWDFRAVFPDSKAPDLLSDVTGTGRPQLYDPKVASIYTRYPQLLHMADNNLEFNRQLHSYLNELNSALATTIKLALARLSRYDLQDVLRGQLTFFTVRDSAVTTRTTPISGPLIRVEHVESQAGKDAATGRFGIVMCVAYEGKVSCYEIFTLRGEIHRNDELGALIVKSGKLNSPARVDFKGDLKTHVPPTPTERLPINFKCYAEGVANDFSVTTSTAIIEKLIELPAPATASKPKDSEFQNFSDPRIEQISALVVSRHPLMTFDQLQAAATQPTVLERERAKGEVVGTYIVDLAVPFKRCIQDLSSGEHNLVVDGIYGCAMDAIALLGTVAGVASKTASIVAKATSMSAKLGHLAKLVIISGISIFNPLDDLPSVVRGTGKLVYKGGLRLSRQTQEVIALAKAQMSHIKGTGKPAHLASADNGAAMAQGTWQPKPTSADTLTVLAARADFHWYALDRTGKAWGPKLSNFTFNAPFRANRFQKTLPVSYTRAFIEKSLPGAKAKIEQAIKAFSDHDFTKDRDLIIKAVLGSNAADATDRLLKYLKLIRTDFAGLSLSNLLLDPYKDNGNIAAFNPQLYRQWIAASANERPKVMFMEIFTRNLNAHFIGHGYNHGVVADDLIHEMLHGAAQTKDVSYASDAAAEGATDQSLNVAALLDLASGQLQVAESGATAQYHPAAKAIENADSLALVISLLDQYYTDKFEFERNLETIEQCLASRAAGAISGPVLLTLNRPE
ncbi:hypothetical protein [Pseudomonas sp. TWP3-2]|uniref:hypothetical protein n=1 Tax=Pseudomonas sp. TWP3-2 TaxID=2804574 RepID=UPI003CEC7163